MKATRVMILALLTALLLVVAGGVGFGVWAYLRHEERERDRARDEERERDRAKVEEIDRQIRRIFATVSDPTMRVEAVNSCLVEQNALVAKWPEFGRTPQKLLTP